MCIYIIRNVRRLVVLETTKRRCSAVDVSGFDYTSFYKRIHAVLNIVVLFPRLIRLPPKNLKRTEVMQALHGWYIARVLKSGTRGSACGFPYNSPQYNSPARSTGLIYGELRPIKRELSWGSMEWAWVGEPTTSFSLLELSKAYMSYSPNSWYARE